MERHYALDALVLLDVAHVLASTESDHASNAPLGRRQTVRVVPRALVARTSGVDSVLGHVGVDHRLGLVLSKDRLEQLDLLLL